MTVSGVVGSVYLWRGVANLRLTRDGDVCGAFMGLGGVYIGYGMGAAVEV